ncbi:branched-chain alpha-keto acid dehydrogenase subunit E2 [Stutzerimonas zhaodongensis]|uniref:Flagellar hook-associated protein 2 n=1 Tax=Stutzerimonas zhaodongensis TaxID=1176257 RepID=A0A3M2HQU6_9GAMM|nr:flagellar filament capping protein FliD [Stutzerimonas zhaodongensis]MCQ4317183.1 flagellar filament capping protein FliD [Stutzerimonas zhaodongensis]RMH88567.1 branched-chain alpha-keto acid dehydrogenase subunit E2 [Stutzerimonas zhaodongensis]
MSSVTGGVGLGTGMNIDSIVKSMVAAEQAPKQAQLSNLEKATTARITAVGALKSAISDFQTALGNLNKPEQFQGRSATSSKSDLLTVTAGTTAGSGNYKVNIMQLATSSKVALAAVKAPLGETANFGTGSLTVKVGGGQSIAIKIDESNNTLEGLRDSINKAGAESGVAATIVTDANGPRLVLSSSKTGEGEDISVEGDGVGGNVKLSSLSFPATDPDYTGTAAARQITMAGNAKLTIDGLEVESKTNTVDSAIEGVTLTLKGVTTADAPIVLGVELDQAGVKSNVQKFVDSYNKLIGVVNAQTKVTPVGDDKAPVTGALVGDATARTLLNTVRNELSNVQGNGAIRALSDMGITTQKDGTLALDGTKLDKVLASNFSDVAGLFTGEKGLATRLDAKLAPYTQTGGVLEQRNKAMSETITKIDKQKEALTVRMTALQERLSKQWYAMDAMVAQLTSTSNSLAAMFENMPGVVTKKN